MWLSGLSSDVGGSVLISYRCGLMKVYRQAEKDRPFPPNTYMPSTSD